MVIRKISVGPNYKSAMHYIVGQSAMNESQVIHLIIEDDIENVHIWVINSKKEVVKWKKIKNGTPSTIEYNINI